MPESDRTIHTLHLIDPHGEYANHLDVARVGDPGNTLTIDHVYTEHHARHGDPDNVWVNPDDLDPLTGDLMPGAKLHDKGALAELGVAEGSDLAGIDGWDVDFGDIYKITGTLHDLVRVWSTMLAELVTPAWDWYGLGGDDSTYDYWPNSMRAAAMLRDAIAELMEEVSTETYEDGPDGKVLVKDYFFGSRRRQELAEELQRVYLLVRDRYVRDRVQDLRQLSTTVEDLLAYFDGDILSAEHFVLVDGEADA